MVELLMRQFMVFLVCMDHLHVEFIVKLDAKFEENCQVTNVQLPVPSGKYKTLLL